MLFLNYFDEREEPFFYLLRGRVGKSVKKECVHISVGKRLGKI